MQHLAVLSRRPPPDFPFENLTCTEDAHLECPHLLGSAGSLWKVKVPQTRLCRCDCHRDCPVASDDWIPIETWREACTCPGASQDERRTAP